MANPAEFDRLFLRGCPVLKRDRIVILLILGLALCATFFAAWFRWSQGYRALAYLGTEVSQKIRFAEKVELLWLESPIFGTPNPAGMPNLTSGTNASESNRATILIDGVQWLVMKRRNISDARGLVHARQSLIQDATYRWDDEPWGPDSSWTHAVVYSGKDLDAPVTLLFDLTQRTEGYVRKLEGTQKQRLTIPQGFRTFFAEQGNSSD